MITAVLQQTTDTIPAVIPQLLIPSPRYYHQLCPHYRGITTDTAVIPPSPLPCSSLPGTHPMQSYRSLEVFTSGTGRSAPESIRPTSAPNVVVLPQFLGCSAPSFWVVPTQHP